MTMYALPSSNDALVSSRTLTRQGAAVHRRNAERVAGDVRQRDPVHRVMLAHARSTPPPGLACTGRPQAPRSGGARRDSRPFRAAYPRRGRRHRGRPVFRPVRADPDHARGPAVFRSGAIGQSAAPDRTCRRVPSVLLAVILALGMMLAVGTLIGTQVADLAAQVPLYASTVEQKIGTIQRLTLGRVEGIVRGLGRQLDHGPNPPASPTRRPSRATRSRSRSRWRCTSRRPPRSSWRSASSRRWSIHWRPRRLSSWYRSSCCCNGKTCATG